MFICNHCPFVKHVMGELGRLGEDYIRRASDRRHQLERRREIPDDAPDKMMELALSRDGSSRFFSTTRKGRAGLSAACTPDFFLFDAEARLVYRGQLDDSRPSNKIR